MTITKAEFDAAYASTSKKYDLSRDFAESFLKKLEEFLRSNSTKPSYARVSFREILSRTLNHFNLEGERRSAYRSLAGSFFGRRGGQEIKRSKERHRTSSIPSETARKPTHMDVLTFRAYRLLQSIRSFFF